MQSGDASGLRPLVLAATALALLILGLGIGSQPPLPAPQKLQAYDGDRHILFSGNSQDGNIQVLVLFHNIALIGNLRSPQRHSIHDIRLSPGKHSLWVLANDGVYRYDARTLRLSAYQRLETVTGSHFGYVAENTYALEFADSQSAPGA